MATVCGIKDKQVQLKFLRKMGNFGAYKDAEDDDTSIEDIKNVLFVCPEPQITMVGTARLRYTFEFTDPQRAMMFKFITK